MKGLSILLILLLGLTDSYGSGEHASEISEVECAERMITLLERYPDTVIVHVKGLVCSSCAIGIRIGLAKIDGLDRSQFTKGIELDSSNQYVILAANETLNFDLVFEKIYNAGYDPLHLCYLKDGKVMQVKVSE